MNPANLLLRFLLELTALAGFAVCAWQTTSGRWRALFALTVVLCVIALWGIFAVPDDPSRSGSAPVPIPGAVRLVLELTILFGGAFAWHQAGYSVVGIVAGALITLHYAFSTDRIFWLLQQ